MAQKRRVFVFSVRAESPFSSVFVSNACLSASKACQFIAHEDCLPKAPINCPPQKLDAPLSDELRHYWVEGNLSGDCALCKRSLSKITILYGFRCAYCVLRVCPECFPRVQHAECDEGPMAELKLGPGNLVTHATDILKKWTITVPEGRRPLMVFINKRSGGQVGKLIAQRLSRVLNPNQIVDLSAGGPMPMLKKMQKTKAPYRVLACGGDGTAAWLLSALDKLVERGAKYLPPIAVLPLGTGNDLARVLGWGGGYDNESLGPICEGVMNGHEVNLDRWKVEIRHLADDEQETLDIALEGKKRKKKKASDKNKGESNEIEGESNETKGENNETKGENKARNENPADVPEEAPADPHGLAEDVHDTVTINTKILNNYFSIGIDAKIALDFHRKREAHPSQFKSRSINKMIYAALGAGTMFEGAPNLSKCLRVELDGQVLRLPKTIESIMVLNVPSYTGGKNPWGKPSRSEGFAPQSSCDGLFELIGISSSFHLGQIQTYLVDGLRLGQGRDITFTWLTDDILPLQLDGEPWEEPRSVIRISFFTQSRMIAAPGEKENWPRANWLDPLDVPEPEPSATVEMVDGADATTNAENGVVEVAKKSKKKSKKSKREDPLQLDTTADDLLEYDPNAAASSSGVVEVKEKFEKVKSQESTPRDVLIDLDELSSSATTQTKDTSETEKELTTLDLTPASSKVEEENSFNATAPTPAGTESSSSASEGTFEVTSNGAPLSEHKEQLTGLLVAEQ